MKVKDHLPVPESLPVHRSNGAFPIHARGSTFANYSRRSVAQPNQIEILRLMLLVRKGDRLPRVISGTCGRTDGSVDLGSEDSRFPKHGGRAMQRVWLTATALGLAFHPMTALPYLLARLGRGKGEGLTAEDQQQLTEFGKSYRHLLPIPDDHAEIMLFRLAKAELPTVRSLRRGLDEILMFC